MVIMFSYVVSFYILFYFVISHILLTLEVFTCWFRDVQLFLVPTVQNSDHICSLLSLMDESFAIFSLL
jgi:hypothetical protein